MKLRNKKTGEIREGYISVVLQNDNKFPNPLEYNTVTSISELNEDWEDYKPKEPLLKDYPDEMRAIKAYGHSPLRFHRHARKGYSTFNFCTLYICFNGLFENLKDGETYTIDELCGEEEE